MRSFWVYSQQRPIDHTLSRVWPIWWRSSSAGKLPMKNVALCHWKSLRLRFCSPLRFNFWVTLPHHCDAGPLSSIVLKTHLLRFSVVAVWVLQMWNLFRILLTCLNMMLPLKWPSALWVPGAAERTVVMFIFLEWTGSWHYEHLHVWGVDAISLVGGGDTHSPTSCIVMWIAHSTQSLNDRFFGPYR